jgi:hypothetical protein
MIFFSNHFGGGRRQKIKTDLGSQILKIWLNRFEEWTLKDRSDDINAYF